MKWKKKHCAHERNHSQAVYYGQRFLFIALSSLFVCYVELCCGCVCVFFDNFYFVFCLVRFKGDVWQHFSVSTTTDDLMYKCKKALRNIRGDRMRTIKRNERQISANCLGCAWYRLVKMAL